MNQTAQYKNIHFVINPGAGQDEPILNTINRVFLPYDINWTVSITKKDVPIKADTPDDTDLVAVYGGDGTVKDVISSLLDSDLPLAILPGGTGNAVAHKLGIPIQLEQALQVIVGEHEQRKIDIGEIHSADGETHHFLLRSTIGLYNEMMRSTSPEMKKRFGDLAYFIAGIMSMRENKHLVFELTIDGETIIVQGHTCMVANISTIGGHAPIDIAPQVDPGDGLLDVLVFDAISEDILSTLRSQIRPDIDPFSKHWQGREISIQTEEPQSIIVDGEDGCNTRADIRLLPQAVSILVPYTDD
jgi:YegS/Rv2252/BmrU family lipid kinase